MNILYICTHNRCRSILSEAITRQNAQGIINDVVITVCDQAAGESCPFWLGNIPKLHWGLSDPSKLDGSDEQKRQAFLTTIGEIEQRVEKLIDIAKRPKAEQLDALQRLVKA